MHKVREEGEDLGLERAGNMDSGWMLVGFSWEESPGLCRDGSLRDCSVLFLLNYSSTGRQGRACSACSTGNLAQIHTCKCSERKCKLEQRIRAFWGNPSLPHVIKAREVTEAYSYLLQSGFMVIFYRLSIISWMFAFGFARNRCFYLRQVKIFQWLLDLFDLSMEAVRF